MYFSGGGKRGNVLIDTNFPILEPNNFKTCCEIIMKLREINTNQIYVSLNEFQGVIIFIWRSRCLHNFGKKASQNCFLNFNIKYFLHTRTLRWICIKPGKYFRWKCTWENKTISKAFSHKILSPEVTKVWTLVLCCFAGYSETWEPV